MTVVKLNGGERKKSHAMMMEYNIHTETIPTNTQRTEKKQTLSMHITGVHNQQSKWGKKCKVKHKTVRTTN